MPRPKTDQEIQQGWGDLQWRFMNWYEASRNDILRCSEPGADWNALSQLVAKAFPDKEHQKAFRVWSDEWWGRDFVRMTSRIKPEEFIDQVMATNFLDAQSTSDLLKTIALYNTPWVPIGRSQYGDVETFYAFRPQVDYLEPDHVEPSSEVLGNYSLTMKLKSKTRAASGLTPASTSSSVFNPSTRSISAGEYAFSRPRSSTASTMSLGKENLEKAPDKDEYLVFAQIGTLHVYGGVCKDAGPKNIHIINQGPWWSNGFAVVVELDKKGGLGAVYVVYNDSLLEGKEEEEGEEEEYAEYAGPSEEEITDTEGIAANHEPGKLHPECNQKFKVAKIADSMKRLGDLQTKFIFEEISKDKHPIHSTKIVTDKVLGQFILHAKAPTQS
ncbi:uncharacterized protein FSUBG_755 [Fusarium subglutinans]|uniref:Uncharacterized protein n=1 Tax=Gibberella subglutinans TaxID=42677 RepID=A0A8H5V7N0_GIBSU|nr:uncharacterized protein FSUBG_755 [Fusarium subglutinans]KAF5613546.1 hypothetical protein FSUBG_755 [Fusarium subglutinans]